MRFILIEYIPAAERSGTSPSQHARVSPPWRTRRRTFTCSITPIMNHDFWIRVTNRTALITAFALMYWVFIFIVAAVFDLRIFRERLTESFGLSIFGLITIMVGALTLNIMANLSKISHSLAARAGAATEMAPPRWRRTALLIGLSFVVLGGLMLGGNKLSTLKRERQLLAAAERLVEDNRSQLAVIAPYRFDAAYLHQTAEMLRVLTRIDRNFPAVQLIVSDEISSKPVLLAFNEYSMPNTAQDVETPSPQRSRYIYGSDSAERDYLNRWLREGTGTPPQPRFEAHKGTYVLHYPFAVAGERFVLIFSDRQRYGKIGS